MNLNQLKQICILEISLERSKEDKDEFFKLLKNLSLKEVGNFDSNEKSTQKIPAEDIKNSELYIAGKNIKKNGLLRLFKSISLIKELNKKGGVNINFDEKKYFDEQKANSIKKHLNFILGKNFFSKDKDINFISFICIFVASFIEYKRK